MKPFFLTGANAKIKVNGVTLAYCSALSYSVIVNHATPKVLGMYEASSLEPLGYEVTGSFTVIRYIADATELAGRPAGASDKGNGIGTWRNDNSFAEFTSGGRAHQNLNPIKL